MDEVARPEDCQTMIDVRRGVDATDRALVDLLVTRFAYMRAAARIKPEKAQVRDEPRKAQVVENVRALAQERGLPADALADLWEALVETSIAYEGGHWDSLKG
ncbi:MAG TPA: chorismate mutase [Sphingobium sp.]